MLVCAAVFHTLLPSANPKPGALHALLFYPILIYSTPCCYARCTGCPVGAYGGVVPGCSYQVTVGPRARDTAPPTQTSTCRAPLPLDGGARPFAKGRDSSL
eukprot:3517153-Rhodomonas_salina.1